MLSCVVDAMQNLITIKEFKQNEKNTKGEMQNEYRKGTF